MKVLVCGGRDYSDVAVLTAYLDALHEATPITRLIHGDARGADRLAGGWATTRGVPVAAYAADWSKGRSAGPIRNQLMLKSEQPDLVIAFPGGRGTADMVKRARLQGFKVKEVE